MAKRHYRRVAERLGELLQTGDYDLLIIGGHSYEVPDFVQQLPRPAMGGLATVGLDGCLWAGTMGAIRTLLVRDGTAAPGVVCDQSRWLARPGQVCPLCGNPTRPAPDVIDELAQVVINEGGAIRHINSGGARLVDHDIGADLRFPLPEPPADGAGDGR